MKSQKTEIFKLVGLCNVMYVHGRVRLGGVHYPAKSSSAVCITPRSQAMQCASPRRVKLHGVHHSAESSSAVCITLQSQNAHRRVTP